MNLTRLFFPISRSLIYANQSYVSHRYASSADRPETVSAALKKFYLKVHPDLFTQYPREKDVNEKSLQLVSAYLSGLQRKEYMAAITVTFFIKQPTIGPSPEAVLFSPHRVTLSSRDLLTSVNSILSALNLPMVDVPKEQKQAARREMQFKIVEIEKFYDFTKIPKISIETWLTSHAEAARTIAKRHKELTKEISSKVNGIKERFKLKSIEYKDDWSVPQFCACLSTLLTYADKWQERLSSLQGKRLVFGDKSCLLQDGSLELGANDPPVYWDHVICYELTESDQYMAKIASYESRLCEYFQGIEVRQDPDSQNLCRAHTYLYHLLQLSHHLDLNRDHQAHRHKSWTNFYLYVNPYSSDPSVTNSGFFQINAYDATMDILDFMVNNRQKAKDMQISYAKDAKEEKKLLNTVQKQFLLADLSINRRIAKNEIIQCCQRLLNQRQYFSHLLNNCRLRIDKTYNLAQNGTLSIPWDWSLVQEETV